MGEFLSKKKFFFNDCTLQPFEHNILDNIKNGVEESLINLECI